jgi:glycosyltransferase involved in cell wall biosynthesis
VVPTRTGLVFFAPIRVRDDAERPRLDVLNWMQLRMFLEPFDNVTLSAVRAGPTSVGFVGADAWPALPEGLTVRLEHDDFHPRGTPRTARRAITSIFVCLAVMSRARRVAHAAGAVGVAWSLDPVPVAGLVLALVYRRPLMTVTVGSPAAGYRVKAEQHGRSVAGAMFGLVAWLTGRAERYLDRRSTVLFSPGEGRASASRNGVAFSTASHSESDISNRVDSVGDGSVMWVHVGGISYEKGVDTFLEALAQMRLESDHRALLLGAVNPLFDVAGQLERLGLTDAVEMAGRVPWDQVLEELQDGTVLVFLSRHEGMPRAPMEAMAKGLPVIVTATGAEQYVVDGVNGLVVPVADPTACVLAVRRLLSDPDLRRALIAGGYDTARRHSYEANVEQVHAVLRRRFPPLTRGCHQAWVMASARRDNPSAPSETRSPHDAPDPRAPV